MGDVRASLNANVKGYCAESYFGRPIGNLLTPAFYNAGWTANQVTMFRTVLALVGLTAFSLPTGWGGAIVAAVFYVCFTLDFVDGNLARLRSEVTYWGKFVDGLADFVFVIGGPAVAGVAAWWRAGDDRSMLLGFLIALVAMTSQMVRNRLSFMREWMVSSSGPLAEPVVSRLSRFKAMEVWVARIYVNGTFLAPMLLLLPDQGWVYYLWALVLVQLVPEVIWLCITIAQGWVMLQRSRRSIHSA